jgi:hypothetical protein
MLIARKPSTITHGRLPNCRDSTFDGIIAPLLHRGTYGRRNSGRAEEKDSAEAHGQFHPRAPAFHRRGPGGENVERAVEENRMELILIGAPRDCIG